MKQIFSLLILVSLLFADECWEVHQPGSYPTGAQVSRLNHNYCANWTTQENPGAQNWGGWKDMGTCGSISTGGSQCWKSFEKGSYFLGSEVSYLGYNYRAAWGTSETPGVQNWGGWSKVEECSSDPILLNMINLSDTTIQEASGANAIVGYLSTNEGVKGAVVYRLVSGDGDSDNHLFTIHGTILRAIHNLRFAESAMRTIRIEAMASDGTMFRKQFDIAVEQRVITDSLTDITITPVSISEFVLFAHDDININSNTQVDGDIGSNSGIGIANTHSSGWASVINGDLWVNDNVRSNSDAEINGDIYAPRELNLGWNAAHNGTHYNDIPVPYFEIPTKVVPVSNNDISIGFQEERLLTPGNYGILNTAYSAKLVLTEGVYNFSELNLSGDFDLIIDIDRGATVEINIEKNINLGADTEILFVNAFSPASVKIHTNQFAPLTFQFNSKINANITAPNTTVQVNSDCVIYGSIYAKQINMGSGSKIIRPPYLTNIWHSEWAYAPPFDINQMNYHGILPLNTNSVNIEYQIPDTSFSVLVNGDRDLQKIEISMQEQQVLYTVTNNVTGISSDYTLDLITNNNAVIYVDSAATTGQKTGASWGNAYTDLQIAIEDASKSGKEIWLAEGTYYPSYQTDADDARSKTFLLFQGVEILGGFDGVEDERKPKGSPYKTILSGDIEGDDIPNNFSSVPFDTTTYKTVDDNAYHVVTISGSNQARSTRLKGVTITAGVADGLGDNSYGGGVFSKYAYPAIEECIVKNNVAISHGAGIYAGGGLQSFEKALFKNNVSLSGHGAGLYINSSTSVSLNSVVFEGNKAKGSTSVGGAIFSNRCNIDFVNCVFYNNSAKFTAGMIYGNKSKFKLTHVTATSNRSNTGIGGISLVESRADIVNTILWDNSGEIEGDTAVVSYSCVSGGFEGVGNISGDPKFEGGASSWGTGEDRLRIKSTSPCRDIGNITNVSEDIILMKRPFNGGYDIGAYEYTQFLDGNSFLGSYKNGSFEFSHEITTLTDIYTTQQISLYAHSKVARICRVSIPNNKYTRGKGTIQVYVQSLNSNETHIFGAGEISITLYKKHEYSDKIVYDSRVNHNGKSLIFTTNIHLHGYPHDDAYLLYKAFNTGLHLRVPTSQFR